MTIDGEHIDPRAAVRHLHALDVRGLPEGTVVPQALLEHREEDPALHRFESVANVGQGARDDDAHRVVEIRLAHLVLELDADHAVVLRFVDHVRPCSLTRSSASTAARTRANVSSVREYF